MLLVPIGVQTWGETGCFLLLWGGWCLGGRVTYAIGRRLKRPAVQLMLSDGMIDHYENRIPEGGSFVTAVLIQLAGFRQTFRGTSSGFSATRCGSISAR